MSRLRQRNRVGLNLSLQTRILIGAVAGFTVAAMFLFVALRQTDDSATPVLRTFTKTYPDLSFKKVIASADGCMLASDGTSFYKVDSDGNVLWSATVTPPQPVLIQELLETTDHGVVAVAQTTGQASQSRIYIVKMMQDGTFGWSKILEKTQSEFAYGACASNENGLFLCGSGCSTRNYILKLNANGDQVWMKDFNLVGATVGAQRILQTESGLMLAGRFNDGTSDFIYLARLNASGQWLGGKTFAVSDQPSIKAFVKSNDGGFLLAGQFATPTASPFVMKTDASGNPTWFKSLACSNVQSINGIASTEDHSILCVGNVFVSANENVNMLLTKLDPNGNMLWHASMGSDELNGAGYDDLYAIAPMGGNRFMVAGASNGGLLAITDEAGNGFCHYADVNVASVSLPLQTQVFSLSPVATEPFTGTVLSLASSYTTVVSPSVCYGNFTGAVTTTTGTEAVGETTVTLYPNPTQGDCNLDIKNLQVEATVFVYDMTGKMVLQKVIQPGQLRTTISLAGLANGTYAVNLKSDGAVLFQDQIVLQK